MQVGANTAVQYWCTDFFFFFFFLFSSYPYEGSLAWWVGDEPVLFGPPSLPSFTCFFFPGYSFPFFPPCMSILAHARGMFLSPELWLPFYLFILSWFLSLFLSFTRYFGLMRRTQRGEGGKQEE